MTTKNPVIKKKNKYYNTLTKRYVTETYAKRINSYFKNNPDGVLTRATGHGVLSYKKRKKASRETLELSKRKTILIETKTITGKNVYYSPKYNEITKVTQKHLRILDYKNKMWTISLNRITIDKRGVYHILQWKINENIEDESDIYILMNELYRNVIPVLRYELNKILSHHIVSKFNSIFGKISLTIYSDIEYLPYGSTFGFYTFNKQSISLFLNDFIKEIMKHLNKVKSFSYHSLTLEKVTIYIMQPSENIKDIGISKYREGVDNIIY